MSMQLNIFVIHPSDMLTDHLPNGAAWIVYNYLRGLVERGHTVHVAVPRLEMRGPIPPRLHTYLIPHRQGALGRISYIRAVRKLFKDLSKSIRFDIAQQFTPVDTGLSFSVLGMGVPLVLGPYSGHWPAEAFGPGRPARGGSRLARLLRDGLAWLQQGQADALIVTCPAAIERIAAYRARKTRVHVISHGIDTRAYEQRNRIPDKPSILFLANLEYWKGIFTLLDAFDRLAAAMLECRLEIWGSGAEEAQVEQRIRLSPFRQRIFLQGRAPRDAVAGIMRSHSVYCMPSYGEPFGMTLLEAMAAGVPIITTDTGGPPYIVQPPGGRIVPMRDVEQLQSALGEILSSLELQKSMGIYNRNRVVQEFDWSRSLDRMESVYRWVLTRQANPAGESAPATSGGSV